MSLKITKQQEIPAETVRVTQAAFPRGNTYTGDSSRNGSGYPGSLPKRQYLHNPEGRVGQHI